MIKMEAPMKKSKSSKIAVYLVLIVGLLLIFYPLYLTIISAFKTEAEITKNFLAFPKELFLGNFKHILSTPDYFTSVGNTVFITVLSLAGMIIILPMVSYSIARKMDHSKYYKFLYFFLLIGIFVPFQVKMMPLIKIMSKFQMLSVPGIVVIYIASSICEGVFLYVAFVSGIPRDLEEAAYIDGASTFKTYRSIIFPLLKPMTATVMIKMGLWIWNDFFLPLLVLNKSTKNWTLTLFQYNFKSTFTVDYSLVFATFILSMMPVLIVYLFLQKQIIGGLTNGAVKG